MISFAESHCEANTRISVSLLVRRTFFLLPNKSPYFLAKLAKSACSAMATTETELDNHISFYPNSTQDEVQVSTKDTPKSWEIYGMTGQIVSKGAFSRGSNRINMSQLATGTYMVKVETEKGVLTGKVIKK